MRTRVQALVIYIYIYSLSLSLYIYILTGEDDEGGLVPRGVGERPVLGGVLVLYVHIIIEYLFQKRWTDRS